LISMHVGLTSYAVFNVSGVSVGGVSSKRFRRGAIITQITPTTAAAMAKA